MAKSALDSRQQQEGIPIADAAIDLAAIQELTGGPTLPAIPDRLIPAADGRAVVEQFRMPHQGSNQLIWGGCGEFNDLMASIPKMDPEKTYSPEEVAANLASTKEATEAIARIFNDKLNSGELKFPPLKEGEMARIILAVEEPKVIYRPDGSTELIPGAQIVAVGWGKNFVSPVHGHSPGSPIHEQLISGHFRVHNFTNVGEPHERSVAYTGTIDQITPGIFFLGYEPVKPGTPERTAAPHNFQAIAGPGHLPGEPAAISLHFLPEHVRDGAGNKMSVVNCKVSAPPPEYIATKPHRPGFSVSEAEVTRLTLRDLPHGMSSGDVFLAFSKTVSFLGPHFAVITGQGPVNKPHGLRPPDLSVLIPHGEKTPLDPYLGTEDLVLLKLNPDARDRFLSHYGIPKELATYDRGRTEIDNRIDRATVPEADRQLLKEEFRRALEDRVYGPLTDFYREHRRLSSDPTLDEHRAVLRKSELECSRLVEEFRIKFS